jgi:AcrR family transcriptional regulator
MTMVTPPPRRTQAERREATVRKLLDAAAETLIDVGYAGATVQAIAARAGVSQGGLFRHFPTREALMVAVGKDVGARVLADYRKRFDGLGGELTLAAALQMLRESCRSRINQAWQELATAARTNPELRKALRPVAERYAHDIEALARELLPDLAATLGPAFGLLVDTMICVFDGEAMHRYVFDKPEVDAMRVDVLASIVASIARPGAGAAQP